MPTHLRTRPFPSGLADRPRRPVLSLHPEIALERGRVHEICGPARRTLALWLAGRCAGPVLWIVPAWETDRLNPDGICAWAEPGRFLFAAPKRAEDLLWCTEEALRAGAVPLVVTDLSAPPALTPVRRMHLAAETGGEAGRAAKSGGSAAPLGLLLTPGEGGAQGIETRWHMAPAYAPPGPETPPHAEALHRWRLERRRARARPPQAWTVTRPPGPPDRPPEAPELERI